MAMGRGGGSSSTIMAVFLALLLIMCVPFHALAATHVVGDSQGWGFSLSYTDWANKQTFEAGDTLVFDYQAGAHNVVPVSAAGYKTCKASDTSKAATTGSDKFELKKGANYFICSLPGHCAAGMRLQVIAD